MATEAHSTTEHAFTPRENSLTAVFPLAADARRAFTPLAEADIPYEQVDFITSSSHQAAGADDPAGEKVASVPDKALDEVLHSVTETFSDDDVDYVEFDRILAAGGALLSLPMAGRETRRSELAELLRSHNASEIIYWGALATERL